MKKVLRQKHMSDKGNKGELAARLKVGVLTHTRPTF